VLASDRRRTLRVPRHSETGCRHPAEAGKGRKIMKSFEDMQKFGKDNAEATMKSLGVLSKSVQAIAVEMADYSKKAFEDGAAATEKLFGAKSLEKAVEVQSDYLKTAYEGFVSQSTKLGTLYSDLAQEAYKPFESYVNKASAAK
jgi:hypothetical protein